jgi:hypothetical protein
MIWCILLFLSRRVRSEVDTIAVTEAIVASQSYNCVQYRFALTSEKPL